MGFLELAHVQCDQVLLAAVQRFGQGQRRFGLADAGRAAEQEHADRLVRIVQPCPRRAHPAADGFQRRVLADDALAQGVGQRQHRLGFVLHHVAQGNAGPVGDHRGHHLRIDPRAHQHLLALPLGGLQRIELGAVVFDGGRGEPRFGETLAQFEDALHPAALLRPALLQLAEPSAHGGDLPGDERRPLLVAQAQSRLAFGDLPFHLQQFELAQAMLQFRRAAAQAHGDPRAGGVEQAHRLVRQLSCGNVAMRQTYRRLYRGVLDQHAVVALQRLHQAAQHLDGAGLFRLGDLDGLEAPRQCRVLLDVLLVFAPGGGADGAQASARQRRLEQVGGIAGAGVATGADQGVHLVDEQDDRRGTVLHLVDDLLQALFEFALDPGAGLQQYRVEHVQAHALELLRHLALGQAQGQAFDDGGLADPGLAGE
ncbi:hypothetical protein D9M71_154050 [compost metagenome]